MRDRQQSIAPADAILCGETGFSGREAIAELIVVDDAIRTRFLPGLMRARSLIWRKVLVAARCGAMA